MALWTPEYIDTALWLDAADSSTITESGGAVSAWADKSGNGNHATPPPGGAPATGIATIGSTNVIRFDGNTNVLRGNFNGPLTASIISVYRVTSSTGTYLRIAAFRDSSMDALTLAVPDDVDRIVVARATSPNGRGSLYSSPRNTPHILVGSHPNSGTGSESIRLNGSAGDLIDGLETELVLGNLLSTSYSLGARWDEAFCAVDIAELFVLSEPPALADTQIIEGYLANKWGLTASLPSDHPYKSAAPQYFSVSGTITDINGDPAARTVRLYTRSTGALIGETTSDGTTGAYEIATSTTEPVTVIFLDSGNPPTRNALVYDGVIPQ